jgi:hypothetical protein
MLGLLGQARAREETPDGVRYTFAADDVLMTQVARWPLLSRAAVRFLSLRSARLATNST